MRLDELAGVKKFQRLQWHQITRLLDRKFGIKYIGGGKYGQVFTHPGWDYVVKIMEREDPNYLEFVDFALKHPDKHYPKIIKKPFMMHAFHKRERSQKYQRLTVLKIEKLLPIEKNKLDFIVQNLDQYASIVTRYKNNEYKHEKNQEAYTQKHPHHTKVLPDGTSEQNLSYKDIFDRYPWFEDLCWAFRRIMDNSEYGSADIHGGNFMERKDGTVVIIDPLWEGYNFEAAAWQAEMAERGDYWGDYEEHIPMVSGPGYDSARKREEQEALEKKEAEKAARIAGVFAHNFDDDIPF
jgi:hypothetical protein